MCRFAVIRLAALALLATFATSAFAASADDFKTALAKAEAAIKAAAALKNQWTTTADVLKAAQAAASAGNYDEAVKTRRRGRGARQCIDRPGQGTGGGLDESGHPLTARSAMRRRDVVKSFAAASLSAILPRTGNAAETDAIYDIGRFGNARVLHMTDTHAQLLPVYFREPSVNIGVGAMAGQPPHLVGRAFLDHFGIKTGDREAYAFTFLDYQNAAHRFGRMGGFAHLKTLIDRLRADAGSGHSVLLDGGDLWQGSGLANATDGAAMVEMANLLGIEAMTGHWEFTYGEKLLRQHLKDFKGEFLAQNVFLTDEAAFNNAPAFDAATGRVFKPATIKELGGYRVGIVGQAMPYVPIAHPKRFTPDWTFGIRDAELQKVVDGLRQHDKVDAVLLLSHNGMDVDLKLASRVTGIDVILGGHTHDAVPQPTVVTNASGKTLVTNAGSNGKFLGVLDLDLGKGRVKDVRYRLVPMFADLLPARPCHAGSDRSAARALHGKDLPKSSRPPTPCSIGAAILPARWTR